jgi:hypothetical protein
LLGYIFGSGMGESFPSCLIPRNSGAVPPTAPFLLCAEHVR